MESADPWDVFIVYNHVDVVPARELREALSSAGARVFMDEASVGPGQRWRDRLLVALASARVVAVVVGETVPNSQYYLDEIDLAIKREQQGVCRVVPVCVGVVRGLPYGLGQHQAVAMTPDGAAEVARQILHDRPPSPEFVPDNFLVHHQRPPFGEPLALFTSLKSWLDDPDAPPFGLLTAPAGRGKSTALCQLIARVDPERTRTVFHAVSLRYGTSSRRDLLMALGTQLGARSELARQPIDALALSVHHRLLQPAPAGMTTLVIVDGLDEASDFQVTPSLFPAKLGQGVRLLVSARESVGRKGPTQWLHALGWTTGTAKAFELPPMTPEVIQDLSHAFGLTLAEPTFPVVKELARISEGEPLVLSLLLEELRLAKQAITTEALASVKPGLPEAFARWLKELGTPRLAAAHAVLKVLARAFAALSLGDIADVMQASGERRPTSPELRGILDGLGRVLLERKDAARFVFSHSGLRDHYAETYMTEDETRRIDGAFAEVVARTGLVSDYALEHAVAHLTRAGAPAGIFAGLVTRERWSRWRALAPGGDGFIRDVEAAWEMLSKEGGDDLAARVRCAMALASERHNAQIPAWLAEEALDQELWSVEDVFAHVRGRARNGDLRGAHDLLQVVQPKLPDSLREETWTIAARLARELRWSEPLVLWITRWGAGAEEEVRDQCRSLEPGLRCELLAALLQVARSEAAGALELELETVLGGLDRRWLGPNLLRLAEVGPRHLAPGFVARAWQLAFDLADASLAARVLDMATMHDIPLATDLVAAFTAAAALPREDVHLDGSSDLLDAAARQPARLLRAAAEPLARSNGGLEGLAVWLFRPGLHVGREQIPLEQRWALMREFAPDVMAAVIEHHIGHAEKREVTSDTVREYELVRSSCTDEQRQRFARCIARVSTPGLRAWALPVVSDTLSRDDKMSAWEGALTITDTRLMVRSLWTALEALHPDQHDDARRLARSAPQPRARAIAGALLREHDLIEPAVAEVVDPWAHAELLAFVAWLTGIRAHAEAALAAAQAIATPTARYQALSELFDLAPDLRRRIVELTLDDDDLVMERLRFGASIRELPPDHLSRFVTRAWPLLRDAPPDHRRWSMLESLVPLLPDRELRREAVRWSLSSFESLDDRAHLVAEAARLVRSEAGLEALFEEVKLEEEPFAQATGAATLFGPASSRLKAEITAFMVEQTQNAQDPGLLRLRLLWSSRSSPGQLDAAMREATAMVETLEARAIATDDPIHRYQVMGDQEAARALRSVQAEVGPLAAVESLLDTLDFRYHGAILDRLDTQARARRLPTELAWARTQPTHERSLALAQLARHFDGESCRELVREALENIGTDAASTLSVLAPVLAVEDLDPLFAALTRMATARLQEFAPALATLVRRLPDDMADRVVQYASDTARRLEAPWREARALLLDRLPPPLRTTGFAQLLARGDGEAARALARAMAMLSNAELQRARARVHTWWSEKKEVSLIEPLAKLTAELLQRSGGSFRAMGWTTVDEVLQAEALSRSRLLTALAKLQPLLDALAPGQGEAAARAALDVASWWWRDGQSA